MSASSEDVQDEIQLADVDFILTGTADAVSAQSSEPYRVPAQPLAAPQANALPSDGADKPGAIVYRYITSIKEARTRAGKHEKPEFMMEVFTNAELKIQAKKLNDEGLKSQIEKYLSKIKDANGSTNSPDDLEAMKFQLYRMAYGLCVFSMKPKQDNTVAKAMLKRLEDSLELERKLDQEKNAENERKGSCTVQ